jgi:pentatricopeptide repeat protein
LSAAQILPRRLTDERTYNMLVSVCVRGRDLTQALHAADMLKTTGRRLDTILYTNLIGGAASFLTQFPLSPCTSSNAPACCFDCRGMYPARV